METAQYDLWMMSAVIFVPSLFALLLMILPRGAGGLWSAIGGFDEACRWITLIGTAVTMVVSICMFIDYYTQTFERNLTQPAQTMLEARAAVADAREGNNDPARGHDWVARVPWIPRFNIDYYVGADGISMPLVLMTTILTFLTMIASWNIERYVRGYCILFLILETGMLGTFLALDFFLFYIFWEVMLLPMYFLIGVWGGPRREYAAIKFFLYTLLGSVFILIAMLGFYFTNVRDLAPPVLVKDRAADWVSQTSPGLPQAEYNAKIAEATKTVTINTFDLVLLQKVGTAAADVIEGRTVKGLSEESKAQPFFTRGFQITMFLLLFIGFAIKVPVFPFHTWLPDAHVEAPTPISMILAGILLKLGGYGIIRIAYPICPWAAVYLAWWLCLFGIINIVYGAFAAMAQTDFKKLVAYSSVSHMGYVILGIAVASAHQQYWAWGMNGAMYQMIAHGITSAGMFFLVGVIYDRAHHRNLDNFRGLLEPMPLYGGISAIIFFAAMGLPGMCGFVGEFMVVLATWNFSRVFAVLAALTVVLTAAYILWTLQRVYLGTNPAYKNYRDISFRELLCIVPLVVFSVIFGILPNLLLSWMSPSVSGLVQNLSHLAK